ncbi:MAG: PhoH family protein, partial [Rhodoferax sp.]
MPLPTAPTKRAALLSQQDFNVPARPKTKSSTQKPPSAKLPEVLVAEQPPMTLAAPAQQSTAPAAPQPSPA